MKLIVKKNPVKLRLNLKLITKLFFLKKSEKKGKKKIFFFVQYFFLKFKKSLRKK